LNNIIVGVGSGGSFAQAAALALIDVPGLDAEHIARKAMKIAGDICVYTNHNVIVEKINPPAVPSSETIKA
jgi:ATP-dependent HslUV protease, peptidase subunit HslV